MTSNNMSIDTEKYNIFDDPNMSDSEADHNEWVSISTSNTISTASTLPAHLNLNPKSTVKKPDYAEMRKSSTHNSEKQPTPPRPQKITMTTPIREIPSYATSRSTQTEDPADLAAYQPPLSPIALLKSQIPNLAAIYIVSRNSMSQSFPHHDLNNHAQQPFSRLTRLGQSPISTQATAHNPATSTLKETYIRVCANCVKPKITIYCDGKWKSSDPSSSDEVTCITHNNVLQACRDLPTLTESQKRDTAQQMCASCFRHNRDAFGRCVDCELRRDLMLLKAVLKAVDPFEMEETGKQSVKVFDMSVPVAGEMYKHVEGCGCEN